MANDKDWKATHPLPDETVNSADPAHQRAMQRAEVLFRGYSVDEWHPTPNPNDSKPAAIVLTIDMGEGLKVGMRVKSPGEMKRLLATLVRHSRNVWPGSDWPESV